jgi:hypothetical protein
VVVAGTLAVMTASAPADTGPAPFVPASTGMLDCNGLSPVQQPVHRTAACSDPRGFENGRPARFEDNGKYVGHDEPIIKFISSRHGSGNDVTWNEQLPRDPSQQPTVSTPVKDVTHWFELSVAPWFSMALCNSHSYPLNPCTPMSDANAPHHPPTFDQGGGGSSFLEVQFYAPGFGPFGDAISCDNRHWCASLHINDLECTPGFVHCNNACIEPTNFAFIQDNGVPTGPAGPQKANAATFTPNAHTLMMNPGDRLRVHIFNSRLPDGRHALKVDIVDLTTGRHGWMVASAANGFAQTRMSDCSGIPFNYQPEYDTAKPQNIIPWAALETNISTQFEIGHFEPCNQVQNPMPFSTGLSFTDTVWQDCKGPYEATAPPDGGDNPEQGDSPCYPKGFTHHGHAPPNQVSGCALFFTQNGDLDFDGTSYWPDWPNRLTPGPFPSPFLQQQPTTGGKRYEQIQFQTNAPASEASCQPTGQGCAVPPPGGPGHFYPYWTQARVGGLCVWEFGQMPNGRSFGGTAQYGAPSAYYFGNLEGPIMANPTCPA